MIEEQGQYQQQQYVLPSPRPATRLLFRRGLPDLPELIEAEENDDLCSSISSVMDTHPIQAREEDSEGLTNLVSPGGSGRGSSTCTSASSLQFPQTPASFSSLSLNAPMSSESSGLSNLGHKSVQRYARHPQIKTATSNNSTNFVECDLHDSIDYRLSQPFTPMPSSMLSSPIARHPSPYQSTSPSPPPSPSPLDNTSSAERDQSVFSATPGFGLGLSFADGRIGVTEDDEPETQGLMESLASCPDCLIEASGVATENLARETETPNYTTPPISPINEAIEEVQYQPPLEFLDPPSPSFSFDFDAFSPNPSLTLPPAFPSTNGSNMGNISNGPKQLFGRKGSEIINKVLPRSLRLKRWASSPSLPKLVIQNRPENNGPNSPPAQPSRNISSSALPIPGANASNGYFNLDQDFDEDEEDLNALEIPGRPTTSGTILSFREQLPTPPLLPTNPSSIIPELTLLDTPSALMSPTSVSGTTPSTPLQTPPVHQFPRNHISSLTLSSGVSSSSDLSSTSPTPALVSSPFASPIQEQEEDVEAEVTSLMQQMALEDAAFAATEERLQNSGWSTDAELKELRAQRRDIRREWEEKIEDLQKGRASKRRRASSQGEFIGGVRENGPSRGPGTRKNSLGNA